MDNIKVSILCLTYNHAQFISKALDSFLSQKTDINYEILINDDASTDGTIEIIKEYQKKYPTIIKPVFHAENQYSKGKRNLVLRYLAPKAKGEYLALCEGDDYWIDENKLQKQVDFLNNNKNFAIHSGNANYVSNELEIDGTMVHKSQAPVELSLNDFSDRNNLITCTVMFRNIAGIYKPEYYRNNKVIFGDWYLYTIILKESGLKAYRTNEVLANYRHHPKGVFSGLDEYNRIKIHVDQLLLNSEIVDNNTEFKVRALKMAIKHLININSIDEERLQSVISENKEKNELVIKNKSIINELQGKNKEMQNNIIMLSQEIERNKRQLRRPHLYFLNICRYLLNKIMGKV
jgi:glycosyltransferase involved in cell wall biosynthesis